MQDFTRITTQLEDTGLSVYPNFLPSELVAELRTELLALEEAALLSRAGTGRAHAHAVRDQVRGDWVHWLEEDHPSPTQAKLWEVISQLKQVLNRELFLGLRTFEGHYALYPPGGFYERHLDCFKDDPKRKVSVIFYLNADWQPSDGGMLRVFGNAEGSAVTDIAPEGGTLVCFLSSEIEHEVLPSFSPRRSFTGWFR